MGCGCYTVINVLVVTADHNSESRNHGNCDVPSYKKRCDSDSESEDWDNNGKLLQRFSSLYRTLLVYRVSYFKKTFDLL